jgi:hypothetical protein
VVVLLLLLLLLLSPGGVLHAGEKTGVTVKIFYGLMD